MDQGEGCNRCGKKRQKNDSENTLVYNYWHDKIKRRLEKSYMAILKLEGEDICGCGEDEELTPTQFKVTWKGDSLETGIQISSICFACGDSNTGERGFVVSPKTNLTLSMRLQRLLGMLREGGWESHYFGGYSENGDGIYIFITHDEY